MYCQRVKETHRGQQSHTGLVLCVLLLAIAGGAYIARDIFIFPARHDAILGEKGSAIQTAA